MGDLLFNLNRFFVWTNNSRGGCIPNVRSCWQKKVSAFLEYGELLTFPVPIESCTLYTFRIVRCLLCRRTEDRVTKCSSHQAGSVVTQREGQSSFASVIQHGVCWIMPSVFHFSCSQKSVWHCTVLHMPLGFQFKTIGTTQNEGRLPDVLVYAYMLWISSQHFTFYI